MAARVIGLTGGIGSGKTAVTDDFAALGAAIVDTDVIAHALTGPQGKAMPAIAAAFGADMMAADGGLNRAAMRHLVFTDAKARQRLEGILHPLIRAQAERGCRDALAAGAPYVILAIPLLAQTSVYRELLERVAVVDCADETRIARIAARSGLSRAEILRIMAAQASRTDRLAMADDIIDNNGSRADLTRRVAELHRRYLS